MKEVLAVVLSRKLVLRKIIHFYAVFSGDGLTAKKLYFLLLKLVFRKIVYFSAVFSRDALNSKEAVLFIT